MVKILVNPDKFIFCIGVGVVGFLFIFSYMIFNPTWLLIPGLLFWLLVSYFLCRKNYVVITILQNKFIIQCMGKNDEIDFKDIDCIIEFSSETNTFRTKRYEIRMRCNRDSHPKVLEIENKEFSTWLLMHQKQFVIHKLVIYD